MTKSPLSNLPGWDTAERMAASDDFDQMLRAAFELQPKYTLPTNHAEQLAADVVREMAGVG
jgi:hypothetical protein